MDESKIKPLKEMVEEEHKNRIKTIENFITYYKLENIGVNKLFENHNIENIQDIKYLKKSDLRQSGLKTVGYRNKVYHAIQSMIRDEKTMKDMKDIFGKDMKDIFGFHNNH